MKFKAQVILRWEFEAESLELAQIMLNDQLTMIEMGTDESYKGYADPELEEAQAR